LPQRGNVTFCQELAALEEINNFCEMEAASKEVVKELDDLTLA
jgi:hypothetical protein